MLDQVDTYSGLEPQLQQYIDNMPAGDSKKVEKKIAEFVERDLEYGKQYYSAIVWAHSGSVDSTLSVSNGMSYSNNMENLKSDPDAEKVRLGEAQNQLETMKSLFKDSLIGKGDFYRITPSKGETQNRCDIIKSAIDTVLAKNRFTDVAETAINDFLLYKYCCIKTYNAQKKKSSLRRVEVQYGTPEHEQLVQSPMAYVVDDSDVHIYQQQIQQQQMQMQMGGGQVPPKPIEPPTVTFAIKEEIIDNEIQLCNVSPKNLCFSDGITPFDEQPAVHEAHYWTIYELENNDSYFKNMEDLYTLRGDISNSEADKRTAAPNVSGFGISPQFKREEVWESWIILPFDVWVKNKDISEGDLEAFEEKFNIPQGETLYKQRWCVFRVKETVLCVIANSRSDKMSHPYHCATFRDLKLNTCGESFYDIIYGLCKRLDMAMQDLAYNAAMRGAQPVVVNGKLGLSDVDARELRKPRGLKSVGINVNDLKSAFYTLDTPDITGSLESFIGFVGSRIDQVGVNQTMLGVDKSRSATGAAINQQYGNIRIKGPFDEFCRVIFNCITDVMHSILLLSDKKSLIKLLGESCAVLNATLQNLSSEDIDKKFQLELTCSFNNPALVVQQMITLANVYLPTMPPESAMEWMIVTAEMMGIPKSDLDRISNTIGMFSDTKAELETLLADPSANVAEQIRPDDNHQQCLDMARLYSTRYPQLLTQRNFMDYVETHMVLFNQQMMLQQQQAMMNGERQPNAGSNNNNGSSMNPPENGGDENSTQRQLGQSVSPKDSGVETSGGLTGTNSTPKFPNRLEASKKI